MKKLVIGILEKNRVSLTTSVLIVLIIISQAYKKPMNMGFLKVLGEIMMMISIFLVSFLGGMIGEALRKYTHPNEIYSYGFWDTLKNKVFWAIGPQVIGSLIALYIVFGLIF